MFREQQICSIINCFLFSACFESAYTMITGLLYSVNIPGFMISLSQHSSQRSIYTFPSSYHSTLKLLSPRFLIRIRQHVLSRQEERRQPNLVQRFISTTSSKLSLLPIALLDLFVPLSLQFYLKHFYPSQVNR